MNNLIKYSDGEIEIEASVESETIWLTQKQIVALFEKNQSVISRHINNIFKDGELDDKSNMQKMHIANSDKPVNFYSLDIILAIGYRTNSKKAIEFRKWATKVLKEYIVNGYAINSEKITIDRFLHLENDMNNLKQKVNNINNLIDSNKLEIKQGIFYNGQIYDAYAFTNDLLKSAKKDIVLVDNYIDDTVLTLFSKYEKLHFTIVSKSINKQSKLDISKYNQQYNNLTIKTSNNFHDRFLLIDNKESYHLGASLKDLGKKVFGFSKMDINSFDMIKKLEENK